MNELTPAPKRKVGRPRMYPSEEKRPTLTFRVRGNTYEKLRDAALASSRSLSEEIELHVERSLREPDFLMTHFGRDDTITLIKTIASHLNATQAITKRSWTEDENTRHAVLAVIYEVIRSQFDAVNKFRGVSPEAFNKLEAERAEELVRRVLAIAKAAASPLASTDVAIDESPAPAARQRRKRGGRLDQPGGGTAPRLRVR
jgi:hypothetical protein